MKVIVLNEDGHCHVYPYNTINLKNLLTHALAAQNDRNNVTAKSLIDNPDATADEIESFIEDDLGIPFGRTGGGRIYTTLIQETLPKAGKFSEFSL